MGNETFYGDGLNNTRNAQAYAYIYHEHKGLSPVHQQIPLIPLVLIFSRNSQNILLISKQIF